METPFAQDRRTRRLILWIYAAVLLYFVFKQVYYAVWIRGFPDQMAHLSYVLEMCRKPVLLPDFATLPNFREIAEENGLTIYEVSSRGINYLTHPSLYYLLMAALSGCTVLSEETVMLNVLWLRILNIIITSTAVMLSFRLGYTRLKNRSPLVHALYACAIATLPMLAYVGASVNNDNLAFLALVIFFTGLLRYQEDKLDLKTYLLIGGGFLLGSFSKVTMALIMALLLLAVLVMSIIRTKSLKLILNKNFLITLPCYLLFLAYELYVHKRYGAWQPSLYNINPEYFYQTAYYIPPDRREPMTLLKYIRHFVGGVGYTWSSLYSHNHKVTLIMNNAEWGIIYWIPVALAALSALVQAIRRKADRITIPVVFAFLGVIAAHFYSNWKGYPISGYLGATQARYYLAMIVPIAFIMCDRIPPLFEKRKILGRILACLLLAAWFAGDAIRLLVQYGFPELA